MGYYYYDMYIVYVLLYKLSNLLQFSATRTPTILFLPGGRISAPSGVQQQMQTERFGVAWT